MSKGDRTILPPDDDDRTRITATPRRRRTGAFDEGGRAATPAGRALPLEDDWALPASRPVAPAPPAQAMAETDGDPGLAVPVLVHRHRFVARNSNPIVQAATPLLLTLGGLRLALINARPADLMREIANAIDECERAIRSAGVDAEQAQIAKYILCATADDIVQNMPGDQQVWLQYSMLSQFFGERDSGVQFFKILDRLRQDPARDYALLELQHACLCIGFEGQYRSAGREAGNLQVVQRGLYETLRRIRRPERPLSPHWEGRPIAAFAGGFELPVWTVTAGLGLLLFAAYLLFRTLLGNAAGAVLSLAAILQPGGDITIQRRVFAPPPPPPPPTRPQAQQLARVRAALAPEIADRRVSVQQTADRLIVHLGSLGLFASADAQPEPGFATLGARIATMLNKETGPIKVVGHTDNSPLKSLRFASNFDLSLARANAVAAVLRKGLLQADRIVVEGRGPDEPVATNDTPDGRAQNRRVDISFERVD